MLFSENHKLAVLIDGENVSRAHIDTIMREVSQLGDPVVARIYADWTNPHNINWKNCLLRYAITPVQQFNYTPGKNSSDFALLIDALEICASGKVNGFCIVTSDADFTPLVIRLRQNGMFVVGIGERKSHKSFVTACDHFIYTETIGSGPVPTVAHTVPMEASAPTAARRSFSRNPSRRRNVRTYEAVPVPDEQPVPVPKPVPVPRQEAKQLPVPVQPSPAPKPQPAPAQPVSVAEGKPAAEAKPVPVQDRPHTATVHPSVAKEAAKPAPVQLPSNFKPMLIPSLSTPVAAPAPRQEPKPAAKQAPGMMPRLVRLAGEETKPVPAKQEDRVVEAKESDKAADAQPILPKVEAEKAPTVPEHTQNASELPPVPAQPPISMTALVEVISQIIAEDHDEDGWISLTRVDSQLHKKMPDFHPSQYRYSRLITLVKNADELELETRQNGRAYFMRIKPTIVTEAVSQEPVAEPAPTAAEAQPVEPKSEDKVEKVVPAKPTPKKKTPARKKPAPKENKADEKAKDVPATAKAEEKPAKTAAKPRSRRAPAKKPAQPQTEAVPAVPADSQKKED